jgi:hypothetical protein
MLVLCGYGQTNRACGWRHHSRKPVAILLEQSEPFDCDSSARLEVQSIIERSHYIFSMAWPRLAPWPLRAARNGCCHAKLFAGSLKRQQCEMLCRSVILSYCHELLLKLVVNNIIKSDKLGETSCVKVWHGTVTVITSYCKMYFLWWLILTV